VPPPRQAGTSGELGSSARQSKITPLPYSIRQKEESQRHAGRLEELKNQQRKLLHLFYKGEVAEEVLAAEQDRIEAESGEARRWATVAVKDAGEVAETLEEALRLLREPQVAYRKADPRVRRLFN
jgi:hypothetical protein